MRFRTLTFSALILGLGCSFSASVQSQETSEPVALVSIAPLDRVMQDTTYLLRACNFPEFGGIVSVFANQYTQGIDRSRPSGAIITLVGQMPSPLIFIPVTDSSQFFQSLAGIGIEPDDLGDGLFEINTGGPRVFAKDSGGWLFIAQSEDALVTTPADPAAQLGKLPQQYDVAVRLNIEALPQEMKDMAIGQIRQGYENSMAEQSGQTEEQREVARQAGDASIEQLTQMISDTEQIFLGWSIDSNEQKTFFDAGARFVAGSNLAKQADQAANQTSDYTAFILPGAAAKFRATGEIAESDREIAKNNLRTSVAQGNTRLEQMDEMPPEAKAMLSELLSGLAAIMEKTIDEGTFDGAGSVSVADDTLRILVGGRIADGNALAQEFKKAVAKIPSGDNVPTVEFDYETYQGFALHRLTMPIAIADPKAKRIFGDQLNAVIGTADKSFLFVLDPTGDAAVKVAIDAMASSAGVKVSPLDGVARLEPLLRFAQSVSPNSMLDNAIETIAQHSGSDKVQIRGNTIPRGAVYRVSIDEGILRSVGAAAKSGNAGPGF